MMTLRTMAEVAATLPPDRARAVIDAALRAKHAAAESDRARAAAAFEGDMAPIREAIIGALDAGDADALRGLRALLPGLLRDVNQDPVLVDVLAHQLGAALLRGLQGAEEDSRKPGSQEGEA